MSLDVTEEVIDEALELDCNLIISHHPLAFRAFKSLTGKTYIERCLMKACKYDLVVYAAHTNLDSYRFIRMKNRLMISIRWLIHGIRLVPEWLANCRKKKTNCHSCSGSRICSR